MRHKFIINRTKCTGCRLCEVICSFFHDREFNPAKARIRVFKDENHGIDYPIVCRHCGKPPCMEACPAGAISQDSVTGKVSINDELCIICMECISVCPFGAIFVNLETEDMLLCDFCNGDPQCVKYCETEAIQIFPNLGVRPDSEGTIVNK